MSLGDFHLYSYGRNKTDKRDACEFSSELTIPAQSPNNWPAQGVIPYLSEDLTLIFAFEGNM
jgi:hypothetical protein